MMKNISFLILLLSIQLCTAQDLTGRKYFSYADSVFHVGEMCVLENVFYYFDSSALRPESSNGLDTVIKFLDAHPNICIEIGVYVDSKGNDYYNLKLSERRARNVFRYLVSKGVDSFRLSYNGYGEGVREPEVDPRVHPINRRTEIKISQTDFPYFTCLYKISFLNQTVEYGKKMVHDTIPVYSIYGDPISDTIVYESGEGLGDKNFQPVSIVAAPTTPQQVIVTSCDGTKNFEVEKITIRRLIEENVERDINGNSIDINLFLKEADKWNATLSRVSISSIYLKGIEQPIRFYGSWEGIIYLK